MQPHNRIYYSKIYWRLNMFRAAYRTSSGAPNCICSLWFINPCGDRPLSRLGGNSVPTQPGQRQNTVWSSWQWAVCRSKHVESSINFGVINSITRLHLVGYFYWFKSSLLSQNADFSMMKGFILWGATFTSLRCHINYIISLPYSWMGNWLFYMLLIVIILQLIS
jgi:hypothetical protein